MCAPQAVAQRPLHLVRSWCAHCKSLAPVYEKVASHYRAENAGVSVGKVDGTAEGLLQTRFGIKGYPTMLLLHNGRRRAARPFLVDIALARPSRFLPTRVPCVTRPQGGRLRGEAELRLHRRLCAPASAEVA